MASKTSERRKAIREQICSEVAEILKNERLRKKLSRTDVAGDAGLNRQTVAFLENQERMPTLDTLLRVTDVLQVKLEDVIREARRKTS